MNKPLVTILCIAGAMRAFAQPDSLALRYANTITESDLRKHLEILASDEYEGRETGYEGQKKAARYLREQFRAFGIGPVPMAVERGIVNGYEQSFALELTTPGGLSLSVAGQPLEFMSDYFYFSEKLQEDLSVTEVVFAGYGIVDGKRNDYAAISATAGIVMVLDGIGATGTPPTDDGLFQSIARKAEAASAAGARVLLIASPEAAAIREKYAHYITGARMRLKEEAGRKGKAAGGMQTIVIDQQVAETILASGRLNWKKAVRLARKSGRPIPCALQLTYAPRIQDMASENVLGYIEGSDYKDELVVVTAHYDHIGVQDGEVFNGADDDGSGTVALLEMAEAFAKAKAEGRGPKRSLLFMPVSGEEKGLLGSRYYSEHPVFPLESTVADLNIDMIGRFDSAHANSEPYVYIIGSDRLSSELHEINEQANDSYVGLLLDYSFNAPDDPNQFYYRSDHYNFARKGIPVIFYFSGVHEDYHGPKDEVDRIRFDLLHRRTQLVFHTAWALAEREQRIIVDKPVPEE